MITVNDIKVFFYSDHKTKRYTEDGMLELLNITFIADAPYIIRPQNDEYIARELEWYLSESLYVKDIPGNIPKIWNDIKSSEGKINSNYGWCVFSKENYSQYEHCIQKLISNKNSRQAQIIYSRPSMQIDWNKNGMRDYMCTMYTQHYIRNNRLMYFVKQRSCDAVFGYPNDLAWHQYVYNKMYSELIQHYPDLIKSNIEYTCDSLHVYPAFFKYLEAEDFLFEYDKKVLKSFD